jgi:hypothetical protein
MTREEILAMPAGYKIDILIAEKIMGWKDKISDHLVRYYETPNGEIFLKNDVSHYSTDISAAWQVVEKLKREGYPNPQLYTIDEDDLWHVAIRTHGDMGYDDTEAETAPLAICRAALLAILEKE